MSKKNQHVVPHGNQWAIIGEGNNRYSLITGTQSKAIPKQIDFCRTFIKDQLLRCCNGYLTGVKEGSIMYFLPVEL